MSIPHSKIINPTKASATKIMTIFVFSRSPRIMVGLAPALSGTAIHQKFGDKRPANYMKGDPPATFSRAGQGCSGRRHRVGILVRIAFVPARFTASAVSWIRLTSELASAYVGAPNAA
jgi:hypothetical protein